MFTVDVDLTFLQKYMGEAADRIKEAAHMAETELTAAAHAHLIEMVQTKLHSTRQKYIDALSFSNESEGIYVIALAQEAHFIEDGVLKHELIDDLLKNNAKVNKKGQKYKAIPFDHSPGQGAASLTPAAASLQDTVKAELKKRQIPYGKIEKDVTGYPKQGLLHSIDIMTNPTKTHNGPGMGHGPIGAVRQGATGIPFLQGLRVYQKTTTGPNGHQTTKRSAVTFRIVSESMKGSGRWVHPGHPPFDGLKITAEYAEDYYKRVVLPKIIQFVVGK